ncbi:hypothetical protein OXYTRIMIC_229 [Oxytricha trifallax]|uniref:Uncharacterized protein n=1 Tax=Oxytricha trifallax TaxID=1172189 RepID=A0A073HXH8_9SPIT|nr:hypothetical protein OXYTRIMIC_229 [Oxytricha trifallax]
MIRRFTIKTFSSRNFLHETNSSNPCLDRCFLCYFLIESYFKNFKELQFFSKKGVKGSKADAYLEEKFNIKNTNKRYAVFLLSEVQGRGTDFHSSREIEDNGGIYLLICDIFSKKSTQQIIGRVGRLENKGQWKHVLWQACCLDTVEKSIQFKQEFLDNEAHIRFSKLQTLLSETWGAGQKHDEMTINKQLKENQVGVQEEQELEISAFDDETELSSLDKKQISHSTLDKEDLLKSQKIKPKNSSTANQATQDQQEALNNKNQACLVNAQGDNSQAEQDELNETIKAQKEQDALVHKSDEKVLKKRGLKQQVKNIQESTKKVKQKLLRQDLEKNLEIPLSKEQKVPPTKKISNMKQGANLLSKRVTRSKNHSDN